MLWRIWRLPLPLAGVTNATGDDATCSNSQVIGHEGMQCGNAGD